MVNGVIPDEIEPRNEVERELAMVWCRLNTWTLPMSGRRMTLEECDFLRKVRLNGLADMIEPGVLQYVWMHGDPWHTPMTQAQREAK